MNLKIFISVIIVLIYTINSYSQTKLNFAERFIIGSSLTYIGNGREDIAFDANLKYHEFTWNKDVAVNISPAFYIGLSHKNIYTKGSNYILSAPKASYQMAGIFTQYDLAPLKKWRAFLELSINYGDYCTCGMEDPYKLSGLYYLGWGLGFDIPIANILSIDFAFNSHSITKNDLDRKYAYTQYVIGLNLDITNRIK